MIKIPQKALQLGVAYVRTSSTTNPKESIPNQIRAIQQYCSRHEIVLQDILVDACETGVLTQNRDNYLKLKSLIAKRAIDVVIVFFSSRLGRSSDEWIILVEDMREKGIEFISVNENLVASQMSIMEVAMTGVLNDWENQNRKKACEAGLQYAIAIGKCVFTPPFGYRKDRNKYLVENEPEAEQVRLIFRLALERLRPSEIARRLNQQGIVKPSGIKWHASHIMKILRNRTYTGIIYIGKERIKEPFSTERIRTPGVPATTRRHPALVSEEEFHKVSEFLAETPKILKMPKIHLLSRVLYCPECGSPMIASARKNGYICKERREGNSQCAPILKEDIEPKVLEYLIEKEQNPNQSVHAYKIIDLQKVREELLNSRKKLNMRFIKLQLSFEDYQRQLEMLNKQLQEATLESKRYEVNDEEYHRYLPLINQNDFKALNKKLRKDLIRFSLNSNMEVVELKQ